MDVLRGRLISPTFKPKVLAILMITIPQTVFIMYNIFDDYHSYVQRIPGILAECTEYLICLFNIHILQVFAILNPNITEKKLLGWKAIVTIFFIGSIALQLYIILFIYTSGVSPGILEFNGWVSTAFTVFSVLYDNLQGLYLIYLVLKTKKRRGTDTAKVLQGLMLSLIFLALMDWFGIASFLAALLIPAIYDNVLLYNSMITFAETYAGIHGVFMVYIFKQLTEFTFVDNRRVAFKEQAPTRNKQIENTKLETIPTKTDKRAENTVLENIPTRNSKREESPNRHSDITKTIASPNRTRLLAQCTEFVICLFNIHILQVFSLLNPNITKKKLFLWKIFVVGVFLASISTQIWILTYIDDIRIPFIAYYWNGITSTSFTIFSVLYDNVQGMYLIYLVLKNKKKKGKEAVKILNGLVSSLIILAVTDWFGIIIYCLALFVHAIYDNVLLIDSMITFVETYTSIHAVYMIYLLKQLTDFTFVDSKRARAINIIPPEPEHTIRKNTIPLVAFKGEVQSPCGDTSQPATVLLVVSLCLITLMDWMIITSYVVSSFSASIRDDSAIYFSLIALANTYTGIHGISLIYVLEQLTELTFVDTKKESLGKKPLAKLVAADTSITVKYNPPPKDQRQ
ncbi:hypothetical protein HDV01_001735 [Terramyces sp. JEL0728]|nr:hypothetical protein HDV01_001735 [Terramyces sp. JEL0728]